MGDSEEEAESPGVRAKSPKKRREVKGGNAKKDNNEEDSEEGSSPRRAVLENYSIFNHSSAQNIYRVK